MKEKNEEEEIMKPSKNTTVANFFFSFSFSNLYQNFEE